MDVSLVKEGVRVVAIIIRIHNFLGYEMKYMDIVFQRIPHNTVWAQWVGDVTYSKLDGF